MTSLLPEPPPKNTITDIFIFLKRPNLELRHDDRPKDKIKIFLKILLILFLIVVVINGVILIFSTIISLWGHSNIVKPSTLKVYNNNNFTLLSLFVLVILGPLVEEFSFRFALTRFNINKIKISLSLIISCFISCVLYFYIFQKYVTNFPLYVLYFYVPIFVISVLLFFAIGMFNKQFIVVGVKWNKYFPAIFYISAILFAICHIFSISDLRILSVVVAGAMFGYTRIRLGFGYSIFLHMLWNSFHLLRYVV